jgi:hypothetical protein
MKKSSDRKQDAGAADDKAKFTATQFGRRRVAGSPWSPRRLGWLLVWPLLFLARRRATRGDYPKSSR